MTNCGQQVEYAVPQRAVAYDVSGAEKMFAVGLGDRMRGYVMNKLGDPSIGGITLEGRLPEGRAAWHRADHSRDRGGCEGGLRAGPLGRWLQRGTRHHTEAARPTRHRQLPAHRDLLQLRPDSHRRTTPRGVYDDPLNLGKIFGVTDRAETLVAELRGRIDKFKAGQPAAPTVLSHLDDRWTSVSWESVVKTKPEVVVIVEYADVPAVQKIAFLKSHPAMRTTPPSSRTGSSS